MSLDTISELEIVQEVIPFEDYEDVDGHRTHMINPPNNLHIWQPGMAIQDVVDIARTTGQTVTALCGYTWVPKANPEKYDVCDNCMRIAGDLMRSKGE